MKIESRVIRQGTVFEISSKALWIEFYIKDKYRFSESMFNNYTRYSHSYQVFNNTDYYIITKNEDLNKMLNLEPFFYINTYKDLHKTINLIDQVEYPEE